jgi:hypothetical protein
MPAAFAGRYDFDRDGRDELLFTWHSFNATPMELGAGPVFVLPGARRGVSVDEQQLGVPPELHPEYRSGFGDAFAPGDFDGDGHADLAVGAPDFYLNSRDLFGAIGVFSGSARGLSGPAAVRVGTRLYRRYGNDLAAGDLDRDGYDDLVVAARGVASVEPAPGYIQILFGSRSGLGSRSSSITKPDPNFARVIAVGDVNGDRHLDLVEAAPGVEDTFADDEADIVPHGYFCPGTATGPHKCRRMGGGAESVAIADVTGDGRGDVVQGDPVNGRYQGEGPTDDPDSGIAGHVQIWRGTRKGPSRRPITLRQASRRVPGTDETGDRFGTTVAAGRIDRDRFADIVVGAPLEDGRGRVTILRGGRQGIASRGHRILKPVQAPSGQSVPRFGMAVSLADFTGDRRLDLAVGAPEADDAYPSCGCNPGRIDLYTGRASGLFARSPAQSVTLASIGVSYEGSRGFDAGRIGDVLGGASTSPRVR